MKTPREPRATSRTQKRTRAPSDIQQRILHLLMNEKTGPDLLEVLEAHSPQERFSVTNFYTNLHRMLQAGWIKQERDAKGDDARINRYWITGDGKKAYTVAAKRSADLHLNFGLGSA